MKLVGKEADSSHRFIGGYYAHRKARSSPGLAFLLVLVEYRPAAADTRGTLMQWGSGPRVDGGPDLNKPLDYRPARLHRGERHGRHGRRAVRNRLHVHVQRRRRRRHQGAFLSGGLVPRRHARRMVRDAARLELWRVGRDGVRRRRLEPRRCGRLVCRQQVRAHAAERLPAGNGPHPPRHRADRVERVHGRTRCCPA